MRIALLPALLLALLPAVPAAAAPEAVPARELAREGIRGGVQFLLRTQKADGSWGGHSQRRPYKIYAPVPGAHRSFRVATTALAVMALQKAGPEDERAVSARRKGLLHLVEHALVKRSNGGELYLVWALGYGLQCLARHLEDPVSGVDEPAVRQMAGRLVKALAHYQSLDGGWGYFNFRAQTHHPSGTSMSFATAMILIALHEAREVGVAIPAPVIKKAVKNLERSRTPQGSYLYSFNSRYYPTGRINRPQGSLTRTPACDLALHLFGGAIDERILERGVARLLEYRRLARMALHRTVPHQSWYSVSAYFYLFGYHYAAEVCRRLPEESVARHRDGLIGEVLYTRHPDGSFWDFPFYGYDRPYGTAYALLALSELVRPRED